MGWLLAEMTLGEPLFNGESEVEQLFKIFRFVGVPSEDLFNNKYKVSGESRIKLPNWPRVYFGYVSYECNSEEFQQLVSSYMSGREDSLYRLIELRDTIGADGLDLLWKLLDLDPQSRISPADALNHPFFGDWQEDMDIDCFEENQISIDSKFQEIVESNQIKCYYEKN